MKTYVVGISGATGALYAARLLEFFRDHGPERGVTAEIVLSKMGRLVWREEMGTDPADYGFPIHPPLDMTAPPASGSARYAGMAIVPCSAGALARIAHGVSTDLIGRAGDVMLKERRPLVLVLRESPYSLIQLRNMVAVVEGGAILLPASPSFYSRPKTIDALVNTVVARVLDQFGIENDLMPRWNGLIRDEDPYAGESP